MPVDFKDAARLALRRAVKAGRVIKPESCERCGQRMPLHGHHHDYNQVLDVEWLCVPCHGKEHGVSYHGTACSQGHEFTEENTEIRYKRNGQTSRQCRACHRAKSAAHHEAKRRKLGRPTWSERYPADRPPTWRAAYRAAPPPERAGG